MSSSASFDGGEITIEPPLNHAEIVRAEQAMLRLLNSKRNNTSWGRLKADEFRLGNNNTFSFRIEEYTRQTDEGTLNGRKASALRTNGDYLNGWVSMADEINTIADACPGHNFNGEVIAITEENQSAVKVTAKDVCFKGNRASVVNGKVYIKFDDGSTADGDF